MKKKLAIAIAVSALLFVGCASNYGNNMSMDSKEKMMEKSVFLMDSKGMAFYAFDKDNKDKSNCCNGCEVKWPVFAEDASSLKLPAHVKKEDFGMIKRDNGAKGVWHLVKPSM